MRRERQEARVDVERAERRTGEHHGGEAAEHAAHGQRGVEARQLEVEGGGGVGWDGLGWLAGLGWVGWVAVMVVGAWPAVDFDVGL